MKEKINDVMPAGVCTEKLAIKHMRQPGQRMPVAGMARGEGPDGTDTCQAGINIRVIRDVNVVVEVDELKIAYRPENNKCG